MSFENCFQLLRFQFHTVLLKKKKEKNLVLVVNNIFFTKKDEVSKKEFLMTDESKLFLVVERWNWGV